MLHNQNEFFNFATSFFLFYFGEYFYAALILLLYMQYFSHFFLLIFLQELDEKKRPTALMIRKIGLDVRGAHSIRQKKIQQRFMKTWDAVRLWCAEYKTTFLMSLCINDQYRDNFLRIFLKWNGAYCTSQNSKI